MAQRLAGAMSLVVFAVCLTVGGAGTANPFSTVVGRALLAMAGTFAIGLVVGAMVQKMLAENAEAAVQKLEAGRDAVSEAVSTVAGKEAGGGSPPAGKMPGRAAAKK